MLQLGFEPKLPSELSGSLAFKPHVGNILKYRSTYYILRSLHYTTHNVIKIITVLNCFDTYNAFIIITTNAWMYELTSLSIFLRVIIIVGTP